MPVITNVEEPNLWKAICAEYEAKRNPTVGKKKDEEIIINFDPSKHSAVFYDHCFQKMNTDDPNLLKTFDPAVSHPACYGYALKRYVPTKKLPPAPPKLPDKKKCTEKEYIEHYVLPVLSPCLEAMLKAAKKYRCFERKRTAFNACDFITEYLYKNNPFKSTETRYMRQNTDFWEIPFVKNWNSIHPRPPLPKSLIWTEEEAAVKIQAFFRGYLIRRDPEVQELRQWQRELREENQNIVERVEEFWKNTNITSSDGLNENKH